MSAFQTWFKAQYRALPNDNKRQKLGVKVHDLECKLHFTREAYKKEVRLSDEWQAALYGWNARGKQ